MYISQGNLLGTAFVGVFAATNDKITFLPPTATEDFQSLVESTLKTEVARVSIASSPLIGVLCTMNSRCVALPRTAYKREEEQIRSYLDTVTMRKFTAVGNMMAANDHGIALSPLIGEAEEQVLAKAFHAKAKPVSVAGLETTGACIVATNKGFLTSPNASEEDVNKLEGVFKVSGEVGSLNYGNPFIKGCVLANSHGAIVGSTSTPFELGRLDDALFFKK